MPSTSDAYKLLLRAPSPFQAGVGCVEYHARRYLELRLTEPQAAALWLEVEADLRGKGLGSTAQEMIESTTGSLDTLPRGDVLDALARTLTKGEFDWPINADRDDHTDRFADAMRTAINERGYEFIPLEGA